jgi:hypothetical protein
MKTQEMRRVSFYLFFFFLPSLAGAAVCQPYKDLKAADCTHNPRYVKAASACWKRFEAAAVLAKKQLESELKNAQGKESKGQTAQQGKSSVAYRKAQATLGKLEAEAGSALAELDQYLDNIVLPEDFGSEAIMASFGGVGPFLEAQACYSENRALVEEVYSRFEEEKKNLQIARKSAATGGQVSDTHGSDMGSLVREKAKARAVPTKIPLESKGNGSKNSSSDITGGKEDEAKRKKLER